ncbi:MAG: hypothetical protein M1832_001530 [Thelocarpon impressellum]|nr:MAG: hypothetical protein M1832_001530 [Thelocarpon impressellum]
MGSFTFKWEHPAEEVYVTGTFDNWGKTVKLGKKGSLFEKTVHLSDTSESIYYKFVVDGNWTTDHTAPQEKDDQNNLNNVLRPDRIIKDQPQAGIMSGVTPQSTSAGLAKDVPLEQKGMPGDFPETPQHEQSEFSVQPLPATAGAGNPVKVAAGEKIPGPSTLTSNTTSSTTHDDRSLAKGDGGSQQTFGVNPLPATAGPGNPINLKPGEKVPDPSTFTASNVHSAVTLDKESYEKGGSAPTGAPVLPDVVTPQAERDQKGTGVLDLPPITNAMIPESSLPMGGNSTAEKDPGVTVSSAAPTSTTAALAGQVPLENRGADSAVPEVVKESQAQAHVGPEAASSAEAVREKSAVEQELKTEVPEQPAAAESGANGTEDEPSAGGILGVAAGGAAAVGGAAAAYAATAKDKVATATAVGQQSGGASSGTATGVPEIVSESIGQAHQSPEAAGNREAVTEKAAVESELLKKVEAEQSPPSAAGVPEVVKDSIGEAHRGPEAAANPEAVAEKKAVEQELLKEVKTQEGSSAAAATGEVDSTPEAVRSKAASPKGQPTVTTGVDTTVTDTVSTPTSKKERRRSGFFSGGPSSSESPTTAPASGTSKEEKRKSGFFRKLSDRFKK